MELLKEVSVGGSAGDLPKWLLRNNGELFYAKGRSAGRTAYEPEVEVAASRIVGLFGVAHVDYALKKLSICDAPVCLSKDFTSGAPRASLYSFLVASNVPNVASLKGERKFEAVLSALAATDAQVHTDTLVLDMILGNPDRHLRNFEVVQRGGVWRLAPPFDFGAGLFSTQPVEAIRSANRVSAGYTPSRPYCSVHSAQLELLAKYGCRHSLRRVRKEDLYKAINSVFTGGRAEELCKFVKRNVERLGLIWEL